MAKYASLERNLVIGTERYESAIVLKESRIVIDKTLDIVCDLLLTIVVGVLARLEVCSSLGTNNTVPVHHESLTMLLLTDATEECRDSPFQATVKDKVELDGGNTVGSSHDCGDSRLFTSGDLLAAGKTTALEVCNLEIVRQGTN